MPITTCIITGNVKNLLGSNVQACNLKVTVPVPFFHSALAGTWISGELASTATDSSGNFTITVIETATPGQKVNFTFDYYDGVANRRQKVYSVVVPNQASALLSDIVASETLPNPTTTYPAQNVTLNPAVSGLSSTTVYGALGELSAGKASSTLTSAHVFVGNASNVATDTALTGDVGITNAGVTAIQAGVLVNSQVNASAAIAYSKLNLSSSLVNSDVNASAAIAYSKLNLSSSLVNADVSGSAAIAYSKLNLTTSIVNGDVGTSAAIARSKLATGTAGHVVINDGSTGAFSSEATLAKSRGGTGADNSSVTFPSSGTVQATTPSNHGVLISGSGATATVLAPDASTSKVLVSGGASADPSWSLLANASLSGSAAISNANLASMSNNTVKGNTSGSSGVPSDLALSDFAEATSGIFTIANGSKAIIGSSNMTIKANLTSASFYVGNASNVAAGVAMSGDAALSNAGAVTLGSHVVSSAKFRQSAALSVVGVTGSSTADVADITGTANQVLRVDSAGTTLAFGQVNLASTSAVTGTLPNANTTGATAATASTLVLRDANANAIMNNMVESYRTIATAAATTTLTVSDAYQQYFTGSTTQTVVLPDATTLTLGHQFFIRNTSSGVVTVNKNGGTLVQAMAADSYMTVTVTSIGSAAGSWSAAYAVNNAGGGTVTSVAMTVPSGLAVSGSPVTTSGTLAITASGQFAASQMPAFTGDITTSAGAVATTAAATQANIVTLSKSTGVAVHGTNTNDDAGAGYYGEYASNRTTTLTNLGAGTSNTYVDLVSVALTAGDWDLCGVVQLQSEASSGITFAAVGISTTSGNSATGLQSGDNFLQEDFPTALGNGLYWTQMIPGYRLSLSGSSTAYLKVFITWATTQPKYQCRLSARRVR